MSSGLFNMLPTNYSFTNYIYIYIYKQDLALKNLQGLICHKTQPTTLSVNQSNKEAHRGLTLVSCWDR